MCHSCWFWLILKCIDYALLCFWWNNNLVETSECRYVSGSLWTGWQLMRDLCIYLYSESCLSSKRVFCGLLLLNKSVFSFGHVPEQKGKQFWYFVSLNDVFVVWNVYRSMHVNWKVTKMWNINEDELKCLGIFHVRSIRYSEMCHKLSFVL